MLHIRVIKHFITRIPRAVRHYHETRVGCGTIPDGYLCIDIFTSLEKSFSDRMNRYWHLHASLDNSNVCQATYLKYQQPILCLIETLFMYQRVWVKMRRRDNRRLILIQTVWQTSNVEKIHRHNAQFFQI